MSHVKGEAKRRRAEAKVNDPNGPLFWRGRYHVFYQHLAASTQWAWGLCWGHASSSDLVHWQSHPPALCPTPGGFDEAGCFSGCAAILQGPQQQHHHHHQHHHQQQQQVDQSEQQSRGPAEDSSQASDRAVPVLLYTGVVMRPDAPPGLKANSFTVSELCVERQLAAVATDPDDPFLLSWSKQSGPVLSNPPAGLCLNCFRDPFILETPGPSNGFIWSVMLGGGIRDPGTGLACAGPPRPTTADAAVAAAARQAGVDRMLPVNSTRDPASNEIITAAAAHAIAATAEDGGNGIAALAAMPAASTASTACDQAEGAGAAAVDPRHAARGAALVYRCKDLLSDWKFDRMLCTSGSSSVEGAVWECPIMAALPVMMSSHTTKAFAAASDPASEPHTQSTAAEAAEADQHNPSYITRPEATLGTMHSSSSVPQARPAAASTDEAAFAATSGSCGSAPAKPDLPAHFFSVSVGRYPSIYWLGMYRDGTFDLGSADGPHDLDLGDILYAPNILTDPVGRVILWAWLSELPKPASTFADYAGCISLPRQLQLTPEGILHQQLLPELLQLCQEPCWRSEHMLLQPGVPRHIAQAVPTSYLSLQLTLSPTDTTAVVGGFILPAYQYQHQHPIAPSTQPYKSTCDQTTDGSETIPSSSGGTSSSIQDSQAGLSASAGQGLVVLYDFSTCQLSVTVGPGVGSDVLQAATAATAKSEALSTAAQALDGTQAAPEMATAVGVVAAAASALLTGDSQLETDSLLPAPSAAVARALSWYLHPGQSHSDTDRNKPQAAAAAASGVRCLGGKLRLAPGAPVQLHVWLDYSVLKVFTGDGQVLSTRLYRGSSSLIGQQPYGAATEQPGPGTGMTATEGHETDDGEEVVPGGVWLVASEGAVAARDICISAVKSIWEEGHSGIVPRSLGTGAVQALIAVGSRRELVLRRCREISFFAAERHPQQ